MTRHRAPAVPLSGSARLIVFTVIIGLADAWLVSWWIGSVWAAALTGGVIAGIMLATGWAIRLVAVSVSITLVIASVAVAFVLLRHSPTAGAIGVVVALGVFGAGAGAYRVWLRRARR